IRQAVTYAMRILGRQFVLGRTIAEALKEAKPLADKGYRFSFDMLGEAAYTRADAARYAKSYRDALDVVAAMNPKDRRSIFERPSLSVKLSALHPRYEWVKRERVFAELLPVVVDLAARARAADIAITIDAEEADRLDLMLDLFEAFGATQDLAGWNGLGLAVQAYQKRAVPVLAWLVDLARRQDRRIPVRLVKGAYWDSEIKRGQELGLDDYPFFTRKAATDTSYLACARAMLAAGPALYPQFATHNAHSLAAIDTLAAGRRDFEYQRLHGMGEALHEIHRAMGGVPTRIYAPVGSHEDLLAYLVRRLLENGANTSFVNRLADAEAPLEDIVADPVEQIRAAIRRSRCPRTFWARAGIPQASCGAIPRSASRFCVRWTPFCVRRTAPPRSSTESLAPGHPPTSAIPPTGGVSSARSSRRRPGTHRMPWRVRTAPRPNGMRRAARFAAASCCVPPICLRRTGRFSWRSRCAKRARLCPTRWAKCAKRWTSCATTRCAPPANSPNRSPCPARPASPTSSPCTVAACLPASARGTSRCRSSPARSPARWRPAMACWPSPPSRPRSSPPRRSGCSMKRGCRPACSICSPATGPGSAR